jgi:hypothetical protein
MNKKLTKLKSPTEKRNLKEGKKVEGEHSSNPKVKKKIAADHVNEMPDYYDKLKKMERKKK